MLKIVPVSPQMKTITIEARPMWETKKNLQPYVAEESMDMQRIAKYKEVKEVFDTYARKVIEIATQGVADENVLPTYEKLEDLFNQEKNAKTRALYKKACEDYKKLAASIIKKVADDFQLTKNFGKLFKEDSSAIYKNAALLGMKKEDLEVLGLYNNFSSFFTKYFTALSTTMCGVEHGSISFRIMENMERYWQNKQLVRAMEEDPELYMSIKDSIDKMNLEMCMTQDGIDAYNLLLGNTKNTGINSLVNEYAQKKHVRIKLLKPLYKIPLAKVEKQIVINSIENDDELRVVVLDSLPVAENILDFAKRCLKLTFDDEIKDTTYIYNKNLHTVSYLMFGQFDLLERALKQVELTALGKEQSITSLSHMDAAMKLIEEEPRKSFADIIHDNMAEALKAEKKIPAIRKLCEEQANIKSERAKIKECYDSILFVRRAISMIYTDEVENSFIEDVVGMRDTCAVFNKTYNMVRNYCTKNPIQKKTNDMFFNKGSFLSSFDADKFKEGTSLSTLLRKDGMYYLYILNPAVSTKLSSLAYVEDGGYDRLVYKQISGLSKMFPKCFVSAKDAVERYGLTEEIREIVANKRYTKEANDRESCLKWIQYCMDSFMKNPVWTKYYHVPFKEAEAYESANDFYTQTERHTIYMDWTEHLNEDYVRKSVMDGSAFLFQLYNHDFSPYHTGKDGNYTRILKQLFSEENIHKLNDTDETALKLASGGARLSFRKASIPYKATHGANEELQNKNALNPKKTSKFTYDICKDRRFMSDKFILHIGVQIGFRNEETYTYNLNQMVNEQILKESPNVLTIRTGEEHLLYYMATDAYGHILEQGDLNIIESQGEKFTMRIDFKEILQKREDEMQLAKEAWDYSIDIKDVKNGYVAYAVRAVLDIRDKYDAIIFLEDYSGDFVNKRRANVKAVYQQFQAALLNKLSNYVPTGKTYSETVQLSAPVSSLDDLKGQKGIVFFVNPSYTANVDRTSGFCNQYYDQFTYENMKKADAVCEKLDVQFDEKNREFLISLDDCIEPDKAWQLHTSGERSFWQNKKLAPFNCTEELADLMKDYHMSEFKEYKSVANKAFYERFFTIMRILLKMHYSDSVSGESYFLSPVTGYDTRSKKKGEPLNSSAEKTYLLMLKGIRDLNAINEKTLLIARDEKGKHKENWMKAIRYNLITE